jgi:hypothetical protein
MKLDARFVFPAAALAVALVGAPVQAQDQGEVRPAPAQAQSQPSQDQDQARAETKTAQGELARVDAEKHMFWIKDADDKEMQFSYNDDTEVTGEAKNVEGLSTEAGSRVSVEYRTEGTTAVATKITIQADTDTDAVVPSAPAPAPRQE